MFILLLGNHILEVNSSCFRDRASIEPLIDVPVLVGGCYPRVQIWSNLVSECLRSVESGRAVAFGMRI